MKKKVLEAGRGAAESTLRKRSAASGSHAQARRHSRRRHRAVQRQHRLRASQLRRNPATDQRETDYYYYSKARLRLGEEANERRKVKEGEPGQ